MLFHHCAEEGGGQAGDEEGDDAHADHGGGGARVQVRARHLVHHVPVRLGHSNPRTGNARHGNSCNRAGPIR
jgi:hypothetical protein